VGTTAITKKILPFKVFLTTDVCNNFLHMQRNLLKWKSQGNLNTEFLNFFM